MRKIGVLVICILSLLVIASCSKSEESSSIKEIQFSHLEKTVVLTDRDTIGDLEKIIDAAKKTNKAIDIGKADDQLLFVSTNGSIEKVSLYLDFKTGDGFIVKEDRDLAFELSEKSIIRLDEILKKALSQDHS